MRCGFTILWVWPYILYLRHQASSNKLHNYDYFPLKTTPKTFWKLVIRATSGNIGVNCLFAAYDFLPISDVTCFQFSAGAVTTYLSYKICKDKVSFVGWISLGLTVFGCLLIAQPKLLFRYLESLILQPKNNSTQTDLRTPLKGV